MLQAQTMQDMQLQDSQPQTFAASYLRALSASSASINLSAHNTRLNYDLRHQPSAMSAQQQLAPAALLNNSGSITSAGCSFSSSSSSSLTRCGSGAFVSPFAGSFSSILSRGRDQAKVSASHWQDS